MLLWSLVRTLESKGTPQHQEDAHANDMLVEQFLDVVRAALRIAKREGQREGFVEGGQWSAWNYPDCCSSPLTEAEAMRRYPDPEEPR